MEIGLSRLQERQTFLLYGSEQRQWSGRRMRGNRAEVVGDPTASRSNSGFVSLVATTMRKVQNCGDVSTV